MTARTITPALEVRRLRAEMATLHRLIARLVAATDHEAEAAYRHAMARDAFRRGREEGWAAGYIACVEDWKRSEHLAVASAWLVAAHFGTIRWPEQAGEGTGDTASAGDAA